MNILIVLAWSPALDAGGVSTMIRTLSKELKENNSVTVLVNEWEAVRLRPARHRGLGISHLRLRCPPTERPWLKGLLGWIRDFPRAFLRLRRLIRDNEIDIVHLHYAGAYQYYFRLVSAFLGVPYVLTFHRGDVLGYPAQPYVARRLIDWTVSGAGGVTAVSKWLAGTAREIVPECGPVMVVHNGLDSEELDRSEGGNDLCVVNEELPEKFVLIVANVASYKGQDVAIKAWALLKAEMPDLHLVVVGEPRDLWDDCLALVDELGCGETVHLLGARAREVVIGIMTKAKALLFPSRSEGLSYVLLEAGAARLPVICTSIPSFLEVVEPDRSALVVPVDDPEGIKDAVVRMFDDDTLGPRLADQLYSRVASEFSSAAMAERYIRLYETVLAARR